MDDDPDARSYVRTLLESEYACTEAADGREGLKRAEQEEFDLVVVDQEMPQMDGCQLIARLADQAHANGPRLQEPGS